MYSSVLWFLRRCIHVSFHFAGYTSRRVKMVYYSIVTMVHNTQQGLFKLNTKNSYGNRLLVGQNAEQTVFNRWRHRVAQRLIFTVYIYTIHRYIKRSKLRSGATTRCHGPHRTVCLLLLRCFDGGLGFSWHVIWDCVLCCFVASLGALVSLDIMRLCLSLLRYIMWGFAFSGHNEISVWLAGMLRWVFLEYS